MREGKKSHKTPGPKGKKKTWIHWHLSYILTMEKATCHGHQSLDYYCLSHSLTFSGSLYLRRVESSGCCISQAGSHAGAFWLSRANRTEEMEIGGWDKGEEGYFSFSLCFWEHHCQCVLQGDKSAAILACPNQRNPWVLVTLFVPSSYPLSVGLGFSSCCY